MTPEPVVRSTVMGAVLKCRKCLGGGVSNAEALGVDVPIDRYLREGVACACPAGIAFSAQQREFMSERKPPATEPRAECPRCYGTGYEVGEKVLTPCRLGCPACGGNKGRKSA